jgi:site-specific DNA recombinase
VLLTILSSLAQDESRSISENSTWGIRRRFEQGQHKMSTKRFLGYDSDEEGHLIVNRQQAKIVVRLYEEFLSGKTVDYIARIFKAEKIRNWDGKYNWHASTLDFMLRNEKYMGDTILQKSYTADFLSKRSVVNDGDLPKYHIKKDHEPIIDIETWEVVWAELDRRAQYCTEHFTNAYSQKTETNPFYAKIICGNCSSTYSRVKYTMRAGTAITKWRCGSCNKTNGHKICSNRYVTDETFKKLFVMSWNEIVEKQTNYQESWQDNIKGDDVLLRYKTKLVMKQAAAGPIKEFDPELMMSVMDHITVYEDGRLQIRFYDETEFEVATE